MALTSPHHGSSASGSGALSPPTGGILSPAAAHDKRIPLNKLFDNLQDLAAAREDAGTPPVEHLRTATPPLPAVLAAAAQVPAAADPSRPIPTTSSGTTLTDAGRGVAGKEAALGIVRPRSEVCLPVQLARDSMDQQQQQHLAASSLPIGLGLLPGSSNTSPRSHGSFPGGSSNLADAVARLDLQPPPGIVQLPPVGPVLRPRSRDASPGREASVSPVRGTANCGACAGLVCEAAGLNGKKPPVKDKEALRKQAADAMKVCGMARGVVRVACGLVTIAAGVGSTRACCLGLPDVTPLTVALALKLPCHALSVCVGSGDEVAQLAGRWTHGRQGGPRHPHARQTQQG